MKGEIGGAQMTNEEFQKIVLEELRSLKAGQINLEARQSNLEEGQREIKKESKAITEQIVNLAEFREKANAKLDTIIEENDIFKELIGKHEVDIRRLQRRIV